MQKLDELVQARLQEKKRKRQGAVRREAPPRGSMQLLCEALVVTSLVLLLTVVAWAYLGAGF